MVKNHASKNQTKNYAAKHGLTYMQALNAVSAQHTQDALAALVAECSSTPLPPGQVSTRIPFGPDSDGDMQWSDDEFAVVNLFKAIPNLTEIIGPSGAGKTMMLNRIIAHLATEDPRPESIILFAGDREVEQARKRWATWHQVLVVGRNPNAAQGRDDLQTVPHKDGGLVLSAVPLGEGSIVHCESSRQVLVFDDWFTERDGSLLRFDSDALRDPSLLSPADWAKWRAVWPLKGGALGAPVIAAFRPGHTSQVDESAMIRDAIAKREEYYGGFTPRDEFTHAYPSIVEGPSPADVTLVPSEDDDHVWVHRLDARRFFTGAPSFFGDPTEWESPLPADSGWSHQEMLTSKLDPDGSYLVPNPYADPYMEAFGLDEDATDDEVAESAEKALRDYWSIGKRGTL